MILRHNLFWQLIFCLKPGFGAPLGKHTAERTTAVCPSRDMGSALRKLQILKIGEEVNWNPVTLCRFTGVFQEIENQKWKTVFGLIS